MIRYRIVEKGFPIEIELYYENVCSIGMIEVYKTGKIYFSHNLQNTINGGISIKELNKILKIAKKELRKEKVRQYFICS